VKFQPRFTQTQRFKVDTEEMGFESCSTKPMMDESLDLQVKELKWAKSTTQRFPFIEIENL
jgi:hypothetical protein